MEELATRADQYPQADEAELLGIELRAKLEGNRSHTYRILFTIVADCVIVYRIRHGAQDYLSQDDL